MDDGAGAGVVSCWVVLSGACVVLSGACVVSGGACVVSWATPVVAACDRDTLTQNILTYNNTFMIYSITLIRSLLFSQLFTMIGFLLPVSTNNSA